MMGPVPYPSATLTAAMEITSAAFNMGVRAQLWTPSASLAAAMVIPRLICRADSVIYLHPLQFFFYTTVCKKTWSLKSHLHYLKDQHSCCAQIVLELKAIICNTLYYTSVFTILIPYQSSLH